MLLINCLYLLFSLISKLALAEPYEAYSINKQFPPIAKINQDFNFQISNDTFKSSIGLYNQITYEAFELPNWLTFDSNSRTFNGSPTLENLNNSTEINFPYYFNFILQGTDNADNISINQTYKFVINDYNSTDPNKDISIKDNFNLLAFLKNFGNTNGKDGIILPTNQLVNITFNSDIFNNNDRIKQFTGRSSQYNSPLPNWLFFDENNLQFSGLTPVVNSNIAPDVYYELTLIATEIEGFTDIEIPFSIIVGAHQLTTTIQNTIVLNVTDTGSFNYSLPLDYIFLDDKKINTTDIGSVELVNAPNWVQLTNETDINGIWDSSISTNNTFTVSVSDKYGDIIYLNFEVLSTDNLFAVKSLPNINATRNNWFQYSFLPSQFTNYDNTNVSMVFNNTKQDSNWLTFTSSNLTLNGLTPSDFNQLDVGLIATDNDLKQQLNFKILGMDPLNMTNTTNSHHNHTKSNHTSTTPIHSKTTALSKSSSTGTNTLITSTISSSTNGTVPIVSNDKNVKKSNKKTIAIACGVAIPVAVILIALIILLLLWRRKRQTKDVEKNADDSNDPLPRDISKPSLNNDANKPNQTLTSLEDPFNEEILANGTMKNPYTVDTQSLSSFSGNSSLNEKISNKSEDHLLNTNVVPIPTINPFNDNTSSFYLDKIPANAKSWRFNPDLEAVNDDDNIIVISDDDNYYANNNNSNNNNRTSMLTVSTAELLNTELKQNENIAKDPRKSTLGLRDSVFNSTGKNRGKDDSKTNNKSITNEPLTTLDEVSPSSMVNSHSGSSLDDDLIPVKDGEQYTWVERNSPSRKPSRKRMVRLTSSSKVDVVKVNEFDGETPEML